MQVSKISYTNSQYPRLLREIYHPPKTLYVMGKLTEAPAVAIVGTRKPTPYGKDATRQIAGDLARAGITIISGLAYGLDSVAHQAAVDVRGITVAVLGSAINNITPAANRQLARAILDGGGAIISEYPPDTPTQKGFFVARNRIIAGLADATLVTEASTDSGSLITAKHALAESRQLMAVPGSIYAPLSAGPNNILRSGGVPVVDASDVLTALGQTATDTGTLPPSANSLAEAKLLKLMARGQNSSQALIESSGLSAAEFANLISLMEITGKVQALGAGMWTIRRQARPMVK